MKRLSPESFLTKPFSAAAASALLPRESRPICSNETRKEIIMKTEPKFYIHKDTGLIFEAITSSGTADPLNICHALTELKPNTSEGATEKHLPVITKEGQHITVSVGSILHPMSAEHSITWIYLLTRDGCQRVSLSPDREPTAHFLLQDGDQPIAAYAYCNLHGFWKTDFPS